MPRLHFIRSTRGTTLFIPPYYSALFAVRMQRAEHRVGLGGWEVASVYDLRVWEVVSKVYGLGCVCEACLQDECQEVLSIISMRESYTREYTRQYFERPRETPYRPGPRVYSTSREIEPAGAPVASPSKQQAAEVLGLGWPVTREDVIRAYRIAVKRTHPDRGGTDAAFLRVMVAKETLLS